ncbi:MAG: acyl-CoA thioesterase [Clostridiales bacterium]|nr:acyl-CoA thioesterase [Clostridiales bacterium]
MVGKTAKESYTEQCHIVFSQHKNGTGRLFGGQLIAWMDVVAAVVARRHSGREVTTASIDKIDFAQPAFENDIVIITGKLVYVGNSSMHIKVTAFIEQDKKRIMTNDANFVMVAIDEDNNPVKVAPLIVNTDEERQEYQKCHAKRKQFFTGIKIFKLTPK